MYTNPPKELHTLFTLPKFSIKILFSQIITERPKNKALNPKISFTRYSYFQDFGRKNTPKNLKYDFLPTDAPKS
jgi:hypothetical protein